MGGAARKKAARGNEETSHDGIGMSRSPVYEVTAGSEWIESGLRSTVRYSFAHKMHWSGAALGNVTGLTMLQPQKACCESMLRMDRMQCSRRVLDSREHGVSCENRCLHRQTISAIRFAAAAVEDRDDARAGLRGAAVAGLCPHFSSRASSPASSDPRM